MMEQKRKTISEKFHEVFIPKDKDGLETLDRFIIQFSLDGYKKADANVHEEKLLLETLERVAKQQKQKNPELIIFNGDRLDAFNNTITGNIYISRKAIQLLSPQEMEATLAHEMAHHKNMARDAFIIGGILASSIAVGSAAMIGLLKKGISKPASAVISLCTMLLSFIPVKASFFRALEFEADRESAQASGKPLELVSALDKVDTLYKKDVEAEDAMASRGASTFIDTISEIPPRSVKNFIKEIIATHPPTEERIARLKAMDAANRAAEAQISH